MSSFKGIAFVEEREGTALPGIEEDITATHIPGGNTTVLQYSGKTIPTLDISAIVTKAEYTSLISACASSGSLVAYHGTRNARLSKVSPAEWVGHVLFRTRLFFYLL